MLEALLGILDAILRLVGLGRDAHAAVTWKPDESRVRREVAEAQRRIDAADGPTPDAVRNTPRR